MELPVKEKTGSRCRNNWLERACTCGSALMYIVVCVYKQIQRKEKAFKEQVAPAVVRPLIQQTEIWLAGMPSMGNPRLRVSLSAEK
jgi:hypothetical protein